MRDRPARTPGLPADAEEQGLTWVDRGDGYWEVTGGCDLGC